MVDNCEYIQKLYEKSLFYVQDLRILFQAARNPGKLAAKKQSLGTIII